MTRRPFRAAGQTAVAVLLISFLLCGATTSPIGSVNEASNVANLAQLTPHEPIVITSNGEIAAYASSGSGTPDHPYIISGLEIGSLLDGVCIHVMNTDTPFRIESCRFSNEEPALSVVLFENVSYAELISCDFTNGYVAFNATDCYLVNLYNCTCPDATIWIQSCRQCSIDEVTIHQGPGDGIYISNSTSVSIWRSTIGACAASSIALMDSSSCSIQHCNLEGSYTSEIEIRGFSEYNTICFNHITRLNDFMVLYTAYDEGLGNRWDNEFDEGNWWSDYDGTGVYSISGPAGSVDHYPSGPVVYTTTTTTITDVANTTPPDAYIYTWQPMDPLSRLGAISVIFVTTAMLFAFIFVLRRRLAV